MNNPPTFQETVNFISNFNKMSQEVNTNIGEEIAAMIAFMRPDLAEEEASELWHQCWNSLPDSSMWDTNVKKVINEFNRKEEVVH